MIIKRTALLLAMVFGLAPPAMAVSSTSAGEISIAQVADLLRRSAGDNAARNAAMAYLAGVGETAGVLMAQSGRRAGGGITCAAPLRMSSDAAVAALSRTDRTKWAETAATPVLVNDMLKRAGCR